MRRWRYGVLSVGESAVTWRPYWSLRRPVTVLGRGHVSILGVHEALGDYGGRNIKEYLFQVIECRFDTSDRVYDLAVPRTSVASVRRAFIELGNGRAGR